VRRAQKWLARGAWPAIATCAVGLDVRRNIRRAASGAPITGGSSRHQSTVKDHSAVTNNSTGGGGDNGMFEFR